MPELEYKSISLTEFKGLDEGPGWLKGHVSVHSEIDDGGDLIAEDAYTDTINEFLTNGFMADNHDWSKQIGYPMKAAVDNKGLYVENKFHETPDAQNSRQKAQQRLADGKQVQLSIGYKSIGAKTIYPDEFKSVLPKYIKPERLDANMAKAKALGKVRILPKMLLVESSIVPRAMNQMAGASEVKSSKDGDYDQMADADADANAETKEVWSQAEQDKLPDSSFAYVEPGGKKVDGITTPKTLRHFPYKDGSGKLDEAHVKDALSRIPQSTLSASAKAKALRIIKRAAKKLGIKVSADSKKSDPFFNIKSYYDLTLIERQKEYESKGFFEQVLADKILNPWDAISTWLQSLRDIDDYADACELIGESVDQVALGRESTDECAARLNVYMENFFSEDNDSGYGYSYMGASPLLSNSQALSALKSTLQGGVSFKEHSEAVLGANEEFVKIAGANAELMSGLALRRKSIIEFKAGAEISAKNREKLQGHDNDLGVIVDGINTVRNGIKGMLDPEDNTEDEPDPDDPEEVEDEETEGKKSALIADIIARDAALQSRLLDIRIGE